MSEARVCKVGDSLGVVLPSDVAERLSLREGERVILTETADGYQLRRHAPEVERQLDIADEGVAAYPNTLRALAE